MQPSYRWNGFNVGRTLNKPFNVRPTTICRAVCVPGQYSNIPLVSVSHLGWT